MLSKPTGFGQKILEKQIKTKVAHRPGMAVKVFNFIYFADLSDRPTFDLRKKKKSVRREFSEFSAV